MHECGPWRVRSTSGIICNVFAFSQGGVLLWQPKRETLSFRRIMEVTLNMSSSWVMQRWLNPLWGQNHRLLWVCYVIFFAQTDITNADSPRLLHNADCSTVTCYRTCFWGEIKRHSKKKNKILATALEKKKKKACKYQSLQNLEILEQHWALCSLVIL